MLSACDCDAACYKCLKHYRNQYLHGNLDRFAALQLLHWGESGVIEPPIDDEEQVFKELNALIDGNLERLETDLEDIYTFIRDRNADADVYVLNIYEPYTAEADSGIVKDNAAFYGFSAEQIARANQVIADCTAKHDDLVPVDIHAAYAEYDAPPGIGNGGDTPQGGDFSFYDPHPTAEGQRCIAETLLKAMEPQK